MRTVLLLMFLCLTSSALASGPTGNLTPWKGRYEITKCIQCPDHVIKSGANLKNLVRFAFGFGSIEPKEKLSCANTDTWIGMDFVTTSDDKSVSSSLGHSSGQCDWGYGVSLVATPTTLSYRSEAKFSDRSMVLDIKKVAVDTYEMHLVNHRDTPSWGYPTDWEYLVQMKKVDVNP